MLNVNCKKKIFFLDIEADHRNLKLLQFGAIMIDTSNRIWKINWYSNPECKISSDVVKLIGKNVLHKINISPNNETVIKKIFNLINDGYFISFGDFDYVFLMNLFQKIMNKQPKVYFINLQNEWQKLKKDSQMISLTNLANYLGVKYDEKKLHNAIYDAEILYKIYLNWSSLHKQNSTKLLASTKLNNKKIPKENYVLLKIKTIKLTIDNLKQKYIQKLNYIIVNNNKIIINKINDFSKYLDKINIEEYKKQLINVLNNFHENTKNTQFFLFSKQINDFRFLNNIHSEYLQKKIINSYIIIDDIEKYIEDEKRNFKLSTYIDNYDLIIWWKCTFKYCEKFLNSRED